jgi:hypothetical protein
VRPFGAYSMCIHCFYMAKTFCPPWICERQKIGLTVSLAENAPEKRF